MGSIKADAAPHFSLAARNPPGIKQDITYVVLNHLLVGGMGLLRRICPVWHVPWTNLVFVTGFDAVQEVFSRQNDFEVPYEDRVKVIDWEHFLLALQDTPEYHTMHDNIMNLWRPEDIERVEGIAHDTTETVLSATLGDLDLIQDLVKPVLLAVVEQYYGVPVPAGLAQPFFDGNLASSGFMFSGPKITKKQAAMARAAMLEVWPVIDAAMAAARADPDGTTVLGRYYAQHCDTGFPEPWMRSALMAMIGGFLPTDTNASGRIMEVLLDRPEAMLFAVTAARDDQNALLENGLLEALRLNYIIPVLWRRAAKDTCIGEGTTKLRAVRQGRTLIVSLQSAMLDKRRIRNPKRFDPRRSPSVRMVYGHEFHYCIGESISNAVLVEIFKSLLKHRPSRSLERHKTVWVGDYPWHLWLTL
jgi:cytochrome P450